MGFAKYEGEEIEVEFRARMVKSDYGVERSPVWYEAEDIEVDEVKILGVDVDFETLPKDLQAAINGLSDELEFEME